MGTKDLYGRGPDISYTPPDDGLKLDAFQGYMQRMLPEHLRLLQELTVSVFWPHRTADLDMLLALGEGHLVVDAIGRPLGSAMQFPMGADFATVGLMATTPRLQSLGAGRKLLTRVLEDCKGRDLRLSATRSGLRLYQGAGFKSAATIRQHQGAAKKADAPAPDIGVEVRAFAGEDLQALSNLDRQAFGADREAALRALMGVSECRVAVRGGTLCGYAMCRPFGRGRTIGPVIADKEATAVQLVAPFIAALRGTFVRVDTPADEGLFTDFLSASGLGLFDGLTEMFMGTDRRASDGAVVFGLAAHSLG